MSSVVVKLQDVIAFLERIAANTDTDPYWLAATELRKANLTEWVLPGKLQPAMPSDLQSEE